MSTREKRTRPENVFIDRKLTGAQITPDGDQFPLAAHESSQRDPPFFELVDLPRVMGEHGGPAGLPPDHQRVQHGRHHDLAE